MVARFNPESKQVRGDRWRPAKGPPMIKLVNLYFTIGRGSFSEENLKMPEYLTSSLKSVYIVFVERLLICLVIVAMVEGCNRSSLLVSVLYRPMKNLVNNSLEG